MCVHDLRECKRVERVGHTLRVCECMHVCDCKDAVATKAKLPDQPVLGCEIMVPAAMVAEGDAVPVAHGVLTLEPFLTDTAESSTAKMESSDMDSDFTEPANMYELECNDADRNLFHVYNDEVILYDSFDQFLVTATDNQNDKVFQPTVPATCAGACALVVAYDTMLLYYGSATTCSSNC